jgi:hypothetical protein
MKGGVGEWVAPLPQHSGHLVLTLCWAASLSSSSSELSSKVVLLVLQRARLFVIGHVSREFARVGVRILAGAGELVLAAAGNNVIQSFL